MREGRRRGHLRGVVAWARQGRLIAAGMFRRSHRVTAPRVAVFVHGFLAAGPVFDPMRRHVERHTGLPTLDFTYPPHAGFESITERFARFVTDRSEPDARLSLVGHSLGGLVASWFVQELGGHTRVDRLVTLATPHGGTRSARFAPAPLRRVLSPSSEVVERLGRERARFGHIPHTAVVAGRDALIRPPSSAAAPGAHVVWLHELGHNELLFDPRVHDLVAVALS